ARLARAAPIGRPPVQRPGRLDGRTCLLVGGTSGIGLAAAQRFLREGARVVIGGLEGRAGEPVVGEVVELDVKCMEPIRALGPCAGWSFDASNPVEVASLFETALRFLGRRLDILLFSAGISGRKFGDGPLHECSDDGWFRVMEVNAMGAFLTNRQA